VGKDTNFFRKAIIKFSYTGKITLWQVKEEMVYYVTKYGVFWKGKASELIPLIKLLQANYTTVEEIITDNRH
jgi:hypothetical protein